VTFGGSSFLFIKTRVSQSFVSCGKLLLLPFLLLLFLLPLLLLLLLLILLLLLLLFLLLLLLVFVFHLLILLLLLCPLPPLLLLLLLMHCFSQSYLKGISVTLTYGKLFLFLIKRFLDNGKPKCVEKQRGSRFQIGKEKRKTLF
jgi:NAD/NADP transhydrogenase beta subunit